MEDKMRALVIGLLAAGVLTFAVAPPAHAKTTQEIMKQIIKDLKIHPPATDGDDMVGEELC